MTLIRTAVPPQTLALRGERGLPLPSVAGFFFLLFFSLTKSISSFSRACSDNAAAPAASLNPGLEKNDDANLPRSESFQIKAVIAGIIRPGLRVPTRCRKEARARTDAFI